MRLHNYIDQRAQNVKHIVHVARQRLSDLLNDFTSFDEGDSVTDIKDSFRCLDKLIEDLRHEVKCVLQFDSLEGE